VKSTVLKTENKKAAEPTSMFEKNTDTFSKPANENAVGLNGIDFSFSKIKVHSDDRPLMSPAGLQAKLMINQPGDQYEREADAMADKVMRMQDTSLHQKSTLPTIQRKCAHCNEEEKEKLQRKENNNTSPSTAPLIVYDVLNTSSGKPIDESTRSFMELQFNHDFSHVKIHDNDLAAQSADTINASAYTYGKNIIFNKGRYAPGTYGGKKLLAHELTHVVQQSGVQKNIQLACLPPADCSAPQATLENFVAATESKPENITKADKRKKACGKKPPDALCTSDGHGAQATALTSILSTNYKSRLGFITGVYVDKDMPKDYGAVTYACSGFMPPKAGATCTFVPDVLEAEAKQYVSGGASVGGKNRQTWLTDAIGTLTHETEHARFDAQTPIPGLTPASCKFEDHQSNLSEMAAHLSEMHVQYKAALSKPSNDRFKHFYDMFNFWVKNGREDISGIVKDIRCKCECTDADNYIKKTVESVATSQKWDNMEAKLIHSELKDPKWKLNWPVNPPAITPNDLPSEKSVPLKFE
jgi:hypothetical protein